VSLGDPGPAPAGVLRWRIKESLLGYLNRLPDGLMLWSDPRRPGEFPLEERRSGAGALQFEGSVRLLGHAGMLNVLLESPSLNLEVGVLQVKTRLTDGPVAILLLGPVEITEQDQAYMIRYPDPRLTNDGAVVFGGNYREGEILDPLEVQLDRSVAARLAAVPGGKRLDGDTGFDAPQERRKGDG
jgi:hypothetical protein